MNRLIILLFAVTVMAFAVPANAALNDWEAAATSDSPGFLATNIADGVYDIGALSGDITYEFVVKSNPDEAEASMCLIGRRQFGDTKVGLKYEQWPDTGTYGATVFGVADYDYGVATNPGVETHLVFVSNAGETALYVNGVYQASIAAEITLSGNVGIGYGAQGADASGSFDNFDGDIFGVAIYDVALSADQIAAHSDAYFKPAAPIIADVTGPGDVVLGVPNDGLMNGNDFGWPGAETPPLSVDNNTGTKFLHFKGEDEPTGIQVTPAAGVSIVTGLTFTTANDSPERDPISFELSGSNESIDGPYELIAAGDIVDFAQADAWPRFTMNATEIAFDNAVAYKHYQVMFPTIRNPATSNSMQIAEIELLGIKLIAGNSSPADGAKPVGPDADLSWSAGSLAVSHDVYFGTELPPAFVGNQAGTSFDPGTLEYSTTYFWQVNEVEADGTVRQGAVLSFTTTTPVGIFEYTQDIGGPAGIGRTTYEGYVWKNDKLSEQYLMMGGGADIWGTSDQFHYAYNMVSGDVRVSASFEWIVKTNDWAKYGVMLRDPANGGSSVQYAMADRGLADYVGMQHREATGAGSGETGALWQSGVKSLGIQKVTIEGLTWIEGLADFGDGWQSVGIKLAKNLPAEVMAGVIITSHDNTHLAQSRVTDVRYQLNPSLVADDLGVVTVPASADLGAPTSDVSGFKIRSIKPLVTDGWGYAAMNTLLDTGMYMGLPAQPGSEGSRIDQFVNVRDTGNGAFSEANGYPDKSYPGIDPLEDPAQDPAAGDDDNNFATEILGCIQLTAGLHYIGASSDDGTIIEIGGVEIGRTGEWKGTSNEDFLFQVEADGYYNLRARTLEGGGGASIELHEIFMDGTRLLLNDVANGGSAVFAPAQ
jgi:hypothetical protein